MFDWPKYLNRYQAGERRGAIFADLICELISTQGALRNRPANVLDIGCGQGFDDIMAHQIDIASGAGRLIGVEPDIEVEIGAHFDQVFRTSFEDAAISPGSIDVAYSFMVLEHVRDPQAFMCKLREVLTPGGVFIGITPDSRHPFCLASKLMDALRIKNLYMRTRGGTESFARYENYPTYYRLNSPSQIKNYASGFSVVDCANFAREGCLNYYLPQRLHAAAELVDRQMMKRGLPGTMLVVGLVQ